MKKVIKEVLEKIEEKGFEAYIVGGYVRDLLIGRDTYDIDIITDATPKELTEIFDFSVSNNLGGIHFKKREYLFTIMTYREEGKYQKRRPIEYNYTHNLLTDLQRRDFTINAIVMNKKGEIFDYLGGTKDLQERVLKLIGNIDRKLKEDPLRILRGIRFATLFNLKIESNLYKGMLDYKDTIKKLSKERIKEELDKILLSRNPKNGFKLLEDLRITKLLGIKDYDNIFPVKSLEGMYAQFKIDELSFTKLEKDNITKIRKILKYKEINELVLYKYGLYLCLIASEIKGIDLGLVNKIYHNMPIKTRKDINIKVNDLKDIFNLQGKEISKALNIIEEAILNNTIKNTKKDIIKFIKERSENNG